MTGKKKTPTKVPGVGKDQKGKEKQHSAADRVKQIKGRNKAMKDITADLDRS